MKIKVLSKSFVYFTAHYSVLCLVTQTCLTLCDPMDCSLPGSSGPWNSPVKNIGVGCHTLPSPGDLPIPGIEPRCPACRQTFYHLSHQGSPRIQIWPVNQFYRVIYVLKHFSFIICIMIFQRHVPWILRYLLKLDGIQRRFYSCFLFLLSVKLR